jgi:outer membrane protein insertion porin family
MASGGVLVLLLILAIFLARPWTADYALQRAAAMLLDRFDYELTAGRVEFALTSLAFTLHDVKLVRRAAPDPALVVADRVSVDLARAAIGGELVFDRIQLVNPKVSWTAAPGAARDREPPAGPPPVITVGRFEVVGLDAVLTTSSSTRLTVRGLSVSLDGTGPGRLAGSVRVGQGVRLETDGGAADVDEVSSEVTIEGNTLAIRSLVARSQAGEARLDGRVGFAEVGSYDLRYSGRIDVDLLHTWWPSAPAARGRLVVNGTISGALSSPSATFDVTADDLQWSAITKGRFEAAGRVSASTLVVDACSLRADGIELEGRGRVAFSDAGAPSLFIARWRSPGLRAFAPLVNLAPSTLPLLPASGTLDLTWDRSVPTLATLAGGLRIDVREAGSGRLALNGRAGRWSLAYEHVLAGGTRAAVRLETSLNADDVLRSPLRGSLDVHTENVAAVIRQIRDAAIPLPPAFDAVTGGDVTLRGSVGGSIREPTLNGMVAGAGLSAGGFDDLRADGTLSLDRRQIALAPLVVESPAGRLELRGVAGSGGEHSGGDFDLRIDRPGVLTPKLPPEWLPTGRLLVRGSWTGSPTQPHVLAHVAGQDLMANGLEFQSLDGEVELSGDVLHVRDLQLLQPGGQLRVDGTYDVRSNDLSTSVAGQGLHLTLNRLSMGAEQSSEPSAVLENVGIEAHLTGPVRRPSGRVSVSAEALRVDGRDVGAVVARAHDKHGRAHVDLEAPRFAATAAASISFEPPWDYTATVVLKGTGLVPLAQLAGVSAEALAGYSATLSASAEARGDLEHLSFPATTINISGIEGEARGRPLALASPARVSYDGLRVVFEPFHVNVGGLSVRGGGSWSMTRDSPTDAIALDLDGRFEDVSALFPAVVRDEWNAQGPISARVKLRRIGDATTASGDVVAQVTSLQRTLPEGPGRPASLRTSFSGDVRVALDLRATALASNAVDGMIVVETGTFAVRQLSAAQRVPTRLRIADGWIHIEECDWTLPAGTLSASGRIGLEPHNESDVRIVGATSLRIADAFFRGRGDGQAGFDVRIQGSRAGWTYGGAIDLDDASLVLPEGRLSFAGWSGRLVVGEDAVVASGLRGQMNGGDVSVDGSVTRSPRDQSAPLTITAKHVLFEVPRGLRSELDAELTWSSQNGRSLLSGNATITADAYRESAAAMLRTVTGLTGASRDARQALPEWLGGTALDVRLQANGPLTLENSVGDLAMVPNLQLTGTIADAGLKGSMDIVDDGRIRVGGRSYRLRESAIEFAPEQGLVPRLNVLGETRIGSYDVTLRVSGPADAIETSLSSNPPLGERDLQSLLVTGQTAGLTGESSNTDAFAVGAVSGGVLGLAGEFVGLDSVRVGTSDELELVSSDVEPSTRLTVSKGLGQRFEVVLSENLDDSELTWVLIYRPRSGYSVGLSSRDGVETTLGFRHEVAFGPGYSAPRRTAQERRSPDVVTRIDVNGEPGFSQAEVREALRLREGDDFDFREWSNDRERIRRFYCDRGYCAVRVTPTRTVTQPAPNRREVALAYRIIGGPRTELEVVGYPVSGALLERLKTAWADILVPQLLAEELERVARGFLVDDGYLRARVEATLDSSRAGIMHATVHVTSGLRTTDRQLVFEGNQAIDATSLQKLAVERDPAAAVWKDSAALLQEIAAEYRSRGYLAATLIAGDLMFEGDRAVLPIRIAEGPLAHVATLRVDGVPSERLADAQKAIGLTMGSTFAEGAERPARARLERHYRDLGYRNAQVEVSARVAGREGRADLTFTVTEGARSIVRRITVEGAETTNDALVDRAITVKAGAAAGQSAAAETQRRLYGLGTFRAADVRFEPVPSMPSGESQAVDAVISVQEPRRYLLRYGIALSDEYEPTLDETQRSVGVAADLRDRNFLGRGIGLGLGVRVERDLRSLRGLFALPRLGSLPVRTNVSLTARSEDLHSDAGTLFSDEELKLGIEQRWQPRSGVELAWGYSGAGRRIAFDLVEPAPRAVAFDGLLASVNATAVVDRRNSVFDASRGWFHSTSVQWGLQALGSDFDYLRLLVRGSYYWSLGPLVLASNARWGELTRLGGVPPLTVFDLFFKAGGTQTVRGYKQDELSGYEILEIPVGGTRLVVFNQEIRVPIVGIFKGVLFADAGNTFAHDTTFSLSDLAVGVGFGLRIRTPLAPIRIDLGYPLPHRPGSSLRWHFSIGQMF